jgi:hypothetical protein
MAAGHAELGVGAVQVRTDGSRGKVQPFGDLAVGEAVASQVDDLALLRSELGQGVGRIGDTDPARSQFGFRTLRPGPGPESLEGFQGGDEQGLGVVDPATAPHPFGVVELKLGSLERPALPGLVR